MDSPSLPVAVIGAGPVGLAAAAHLISRGETPLIFEAGPEVGANIRQWGHVTIFSPWRYNIDQAAAQLLSAQGWQAPPDDLLPTGDQLVDDYLQPLAATPAIQAHLHLNARVTAISRRRIDKMKDRGRDNAPFVLHVQEQDQAEIYLARAVIDASGTWATPNPLGADGLFAPGEQTNQAQIFYGIPDILGKARSRYAGKKVAVVGGGHSAINAILELVDLQAEVPNTQIVWVLRKANAASTYGGLENDALPGRGLLGIRIKQIVESGAIQVRTPFFIQRIAKAGEQVQLIGEATSGANVIEADEIIAATGARPDLSFLREVRLTLDPSVESPTALAPLIDPNLHSCGTVPPHGEKELRHVEANFYMVGMKSYGRAPTFLMLTGYEQVRSVVAALVGDWEAAAEVQLVLPETGVCGVPATVDANGVSTGSGCCGSAPTAQSSLIDLDLTSLPLASTASVDCCGVTACCTDQAPVAADQCCTPATKAAFAGVLEATTAQGNCCS